MELEFKDLTKNFGGFTAVDHINLVMTNGVYGLLGVNGAGTGQDIRSDRHQRRRQNDSDAYVVHAAFAHERHNYL